jgi:hypothetical protein
LVESHVAASDATDPPLVSAAGIVPLAQASIANEGSESRGRVRMGCIRGWMTGRE